jgi:hypothetical protein
MLVVYIFVECRMHAVASCIFSDPEIVVCNLRKYGLLRSCITGYNRINEYTALVKQYLQGEGNIWRDP